MIERDKVNRKSHPKPQGIANDIYRYFGTLFRPMITTENPSTISQIPEQWYVKNEDVHQALDQCITGNLNQRILLVGHTGIGKSSIVRNYFSNSMNPTIVDNYLILPFYFDSQNTRGALEFDLLKPKIFAACEMIKDKYKIRYNKTSLASFIKSHRYDLLFRGSVGFDTPLIKRLDALERENPYAYTAELLKYFIIKSELSGVKIVIDDIDTVQPEKLQIEFALSACKFTYCLQNHHNPQKQYFSTLLLISCRPHTEASLKADRVFRGMAFEQAVYIKRPVKLRALFERRFQAALSDPSITSGIEKRDSFGAAREILFRIVDALSEIDPDFLLGINNFSVRNALKTLQEILSNRRYIQKNKTVSPHFKLNISDFNITNS